MSSLAPSGGGLGLAPSGTVDADRLGRGCCCEGGEGGLSVPLATEGGTEGEGIRRGGEVARFYQCLRLCSCGTKPQRSENHHFVMTSSWEPQCHHDIIMRTTRITGKPKFSSSGGL